MVKQNLVEKSAVEKLSEEILEVPLSSIQIDPLQPRRHFAALELEELAQSIQAVGLIQPPIVRFLAESKKYEIIAGERRFRAVQSLGLTQISVILRSSTKEQSAQVALIENIQRVDLNPLEIAKALKSLIHQFGYQQEELAKRLGKKRSTVANYVRLLNLPLNMQESLQKGTLSMGHAKAILSLEKLEKRQLLHDLILQKGLTVRQTEEAALNLDQKRKKGSSLIQVNALYLQQLAEKIQLKLGTKVTMQGKDQKGKITIDYYNLDDLDRLLKLFKIED